jgi:5'-nucleotidase
LRILVSNDDGIEAPGLQPLVDALSSLGKVQVVAPRTEQSASSHSLTMHEPLRVREHRPGWRSVSGTPADCIYMAVHHLLEHRPDLVVSGINRGANLSTDVIYSGTVAAAMEACMMGLPALAVSLSLRDRNPHGWAAAAALAAGVARDILERGLPLETLLNLNVPDIPAEDIRGVRVCPLGRRHYHPLVDLRRDPRGRPYYWIGGPHHRFEDLPESDGPLLEQGWATLTPLQPDLTAYPLMAELARWPSTSTG